MRINQLGFQEKKVVSPICQLKNYKKSVSKSFTIKNSKQLV